MPDLAFHMAKLACGDENVHSFRDVGDSQAIQATRIMNDPQHHIDALVKAGVLEEAKWAPRLGDFVPAGGTVTDMGRVCYVVVPAHKHEWTVLVGRSNSDTLLLVCNGAECDKVKTVANRLPFPL